MNRREFLGNAVLVGAGTVIGGCVGGRTTALAGDFAWGCLLHVGANMWGDWTFDGKRIPVSPEDERVKWPDLKLSAKGVLPSITRGYLRLERPVFHECTDLMRGEGLNLVMLDVGESLAFPSHPELAVAGSWSPDAYRVELERLRGLGLEPVPKLNFSAGHDQWLKQYHYVTSTKKYYEVVADVIRDTCEVFGSPRYFHLGFDEEIVAAVAGRQVAVMRQGELWWHDFFHAVREVERHGAQAMLWSDKICGGREEFLKRMSKGVLQVPWYYGKDFSDEKLKWDPKFEQSQKWDIQRNLASAILELDKAGFDMMPCTSNWECPEATEAMVGFCRARVDPRHLKGFLTAPWADCYTEEKPKLLAGIRLLGAAKRKFS